MKNVIFIVIDSIFYDKILSNNYRNTPTPFLNKLIGKGLSTTKMFAEAPYTEAALVSLFCGCDTLMQGGYFEKLKNKKTIFEVYKESGYDVFFNCVQPHIYPSYCYPSITDSYYNVAYNFSYFWDYRLEFYSNLYKNNKFDEKYFSVLIPMLEDNFNTCLTFFKELKNKDKTTEIIYNMMDLTDLEFNNEKMLKEYEKFKESKKDYILDLMRKGKNHSIFEVKNYPLNKKTTNEFNYELFNEYSYIFKKIYRVNFFKNLLNNKIVYYDFFRDNKKFIKLLKVYKNALFDKDLMDKIDYRIPSKQNSPTIDTSFNHFIKWLKNRNTKKPYFAYIHSGECHYPEIFYSHDSMNKEKLANEFKMITDFVSNLPKNYKGSVAYDLSLLYTDMCVKNLYTYLENNNLLENTIVALCADHGSSYTFDPFHESYVKNVYRENYHIPFILLGDNIKHEIKTNYFNSKDIPATIIDASGLKIPEEYDGKSLLKYDGLDYAILENVNGGCPDYNLRPILIGCRTDNYSVTMEFYIHSSFDKGKLYSVYDLKKDNHERNNLNTKKDIYLKIEYECKIIKEKYNELLKDIEKNNFLKEIEDE